jgi:hypothetical protein
MAGDTQGKSVRPLPGKLILLIADYTNYEQQSNNEPEKKIKRQCESAYRCAQ